jgi:hypothetical protein
VVLEIDVMTASATAELAFLEPKIEPVQLSPFTAATLLRDRHCNFIAKLIAIFINNLAI